MPERLQRPHRIGCTDLHLPPVISRHPWLTDVRVSFSLAGRVRSDHLRVTSVRNEHRFIYTDPWPRTTLVPRTLQVKSFCLRLRFRSGSALAGRHMLRGLITTAALTSRGPEPPCRTRRLFYRGKYPTSGRTRDSSIAKMGPALCRRNILVLVRTHRKSRVVSNATLSSSTLGQDSRAKCHLPGEPGIHW